MKKGSIAPRHFALAAAALSLAGGPTTAGAAVLCVPVATVNAVCTAPTTYTTIQAAVSAASPGDIIVVGPGTYTASPASGPVVLIPASQHDLTILGAQAGRDAREDRGDSSEESIVDATGTTGATNAGFIVQAANVIIDGFTIQNANNAANANDSGIDLKGNGNGLTPANGAKILNNILQNNGQALSLNFEGVGPVANVLIQHNLFRNNNVVSGDGIFTSACQDVIITENNFSNDPTAAIGINNSANVSITYNQSNGDGAFVIFTNTTNSEFSHNQGRNFVAPGAAFPGTGGAAISIGPSNSFLTINNNNLQKGQGIDGIRFWLFGATPGGNIGPSQNLTVSDNEIRLMSLSGIVAEAIAGGSSLGGSLLLGNDVQISGGDGILMDTGNTGNLLTQNESGENGGLDCHDNSTGTGTLGTGNTWFNDTGATSSPTGLCSPESDEGDDNGGGDDNQGNGNQQGNGNRGPRGRGRGNQNGGN